MDADDHSSRAMKIVDGMDGLEGSLPDGPRLKWGSLSPRGPDTLKSALELNSKMGEPCVQYGWTGRYFHRIGVAAGEQRTAMVPCAVIASANGGIRHGHPMCSLRGRLGLGGR